eukprot:184622-Chlamydomonas_euryale.AAC.1
MEDRMHRRAGRKGTGYRALREHTHTHTHARARTLSSRPPSAPTTNAPRCSGSTARLAARTPPASLRPAASPAPPPEAAAAAAAAAACGKSAGRPILTPVASRMRRTQLPTRMPSSVSSARASAGASTFTPHTLTSPHADTLRARRKWRGGWGGQTVCVEGGCQRDTERVIGGSNSDGAGATGRGRARG